MKIFTRLTSLLILLLLMPVTAVAQGYGDHDMHSGERHEQRMEHMAKRLDLTGEQEEQWQALHEANHPRMQEIHNEMREQHEALQAASRDGFDEAAAEEAAERLGDLTREASLMRARMHAQINEMLTEEQREKFRKHHEQRGKHGQGMEHGNQMHQDKDKGRGH